MAVKTKDGWATRKQIVRQGVYAPITMDDGCASAQFAELRGLARVLARVARITCGRGPELEYLFLRAEKAWRKARASLIEKMGTAIDNEAELDKKAAEIFNGMDADKNGSIDSDELKKAFHDVGVELKNKEVKAMMEEADQDGCARLLHAPRAASPSRPAARRGSVAAHCLSSRPSFFSSTHSFTSILAPNLSAATASSISRSSSSWCGWR